MSRIFLGKPLHWAGLAALAGVLWWLGAHYWHTRDFSSFLLILLAVTVIIVAVVVATTRRGERVTRDPLEPLD